MGAWSKWIIDNNLKERVSIRSNISNDELSFLYKHSYALILPSLYEGFGIPLIEGIYYNKDILCSDIKIFNEIGSDFVLYFNPYEIKDITNKINNFISTNIKTKNTELREEILARFTWINSAKRLSSAINKILMKLC